MAEHVGGIRVLVVDDDPDFAALTATSLESSAADIHTETVANVDDALARLDARVADCVVSDFDMPGRNGIDFLEAVRERNADLPFILYTSTGSESVASEAISAGVTDYLQKNSSQSQYALLANRIVHAVEGYRTDRELAARRHRLETLISNLPGIVYRARNDPGWPMDYVAGECAAITGYPAAAFERGAVSLGDDLIHPDDREPVWAAVQESLGAGTAFEVTYRIRAADGETRWLWERGRPVDDTAEGTQVLEGFITEITERVQRERAVEHLAETTEALLREERPAAVADVVVESLNSLLDHAAGAVFLCDDPDGELLPVAWSQLEGDAGDIPQPIGPTDEVAWSVFESGAARRRSWAGGGTDPVEGGAAGGTELLLSLGTHGLLRLRSTKTEGFDPPVRSFADTLAAHTRTALDRIRRERELQQYETIVETVPEGVFILDAAGRIDIGNRTAGELMGFETDDLVGESYQRLIEEGVLEEPVVERYLEEVSAMLSAETDREYGTFEMPVTVDGADRIYETHLALRPSAGEFRGTIGIVRDVTERVRRQRQLEEQNERLERFASIVSHDLRNPLNVAQGRTELARAERDSEHLAAVTRALERSEQLIDDILTLAREGEAVKSFEPVSLSRLVESCWENVETDRASLSVATDRTVRADSGRLRQLLENLLRNAIDHGPPTVTVTVGEVSDGFSVADDGPGVPAEEREAVFEAGYSTAAEGTGFGLSIVERIAEAHGWELTLRDDDGARFELTGVEFD